MPFHSRNLLSLWKITMFDRLIGNSSIKCSIFHSKVLDQRDPPDTLRCQTSLRKPQKQWRSMEDVMGIIYIAISRFFSSKPCLIAPPGMFLGFDIVAQSISSPSIQEWSTSTIHRCSGHIPSMFGGLNPKTLLNYLLKSQVGLQHFNIFIDI